MATWLTAIVMNSSRTIIRKRGRMRFFSIDEPKDWANGVQITEILPDGRPDPEVQLRHSEYERRLRRLWAHLPASMRVVVRMRTIEGRSVRETADALGLTESAVKSRASRALATLRRLDQKTSFRAIGSPPDLQSQWIRSSKRSMNLVRKLQTDSGPRRESNE
jgi:RNA polymerase sigma factor (sigma-70 family)